MRPAGSEGVALREVSRAGGRGRPLATGRAAGHAGHGPAALIWIAIAIAVLDRGGFTTAGKVAFASTAVLAAAAGLLHGRRAAVRAALSPFAGVLLALALLGALSSLWTVGFPEDALTWALLPAGYGALAIAVAAASSADSGARTRQAVLAALCACAAVSGFAGLVGAATFSEPLAFRPTGAWRPAGTLEYTPALALLMVFALPALLRALCARGRIAWAVAPPAVVAGAVLGLSHSRVGVAMALVVAAAAVAVPARTVRARRHDAIAAVALVVLAGVGARACLGGAVPAGAEPQAWRLAVVISACACAPIAWIALRRLSRNAAPLLLAASVAALIAAGSIAGFAGSAALRTEQRPQASLARHKAERPIHDDLLHGRGALWQASLTAFGRRPLAGHGAGAVLTATLDLQSRPLTVYVHDLPLELAVELGLLGALLAIALYLVVARGCWRARRRTDAWLLAVPALAFLLANLVDWSWHIAGLGAPWAAGAAVLLSRSGGDAPTPASSSSTR